MKRCLQLAALGNGYVAPNPMVGAVLVHQNRIIGEGYHRQYGFEHAEVNCINSVKKEDQSLLEQSTMYVSLEPCTHYGKTPPCSDLIIKSKIPNVVIGCRDPFHEVNGKGIEKLSHAGIKVVQGVMENECIKLNKRFFTFHNRHRPYIILKWAQTLNGKIGNNDQSRLLITNEYTNRIVHKWRSEEMAILVGTNTALFDDPSLSTRLWPGKSPIRLVIDLHLRLPQSLKIFSPGQGTIIFNLHKHTIESNSLEDLKQEGVGFYQVTEDVQLVHQVLNALYFLNISSVLVEGGAQLLQSFINEGAWDEARVITNEDLSVNGGISAPVLSGEEFLGSEMHSSDTIRYFKKHEVY